MLRVLLYQIRVFDREMRFGVIEALLVRKLSLQLANPKVLVRYLANLRALPDELKLAALTA